MAWYVCRYCARRTTSALSGFCARSPTKSHDLIVVQAQYTCKYCGRKSSEPFAGPCKASPHRNHELAG
jgi:hypothetical protein